MQAEQAAPTTIDEYIAACPPDVQPTLRQLRATVLAAAPGAAEDIKYGMPAFVLDGNLVFFAAFKKHVGFYGVSMADGLREELAPYAGPKGSLKVPFGRPVPLDLIDKAVKVRVRENREAADARRTK
jgi:uncharacterized protein YdhG (YjbR/CyaY superfamily)